MRKLRFIRAISVLSKKSRMFSRTVIIAAFTAALAVLYALVSLAMAQVRRSVETQYMDNGRAIARVYALMFENTVLQSLGDLDIYINSDVVQNGTEQDIVDYMMAHKEWRPKNFLYVFYAGTDGTFYSDNGGTTQIDDRDYFKDIIEGAKDSSVGSSVVARLSGRQVLHVARALRMSDGTLRGIVGGVMAMSRVNEVFALAVKTDERGAFTPFVADSSMTNLLPDNNDVVVMSGDYSEMLEDGSVHVIASHSVGPGGVSHHEDSRLFVKKVSDMNWYAGATSHDKAFFAVCDTLDRVKIIVFLAAAASLIVYYIVSMVSLHRLKKLSEEELESDSVTGLLTRQALEKKAQKELTASPAGPYVVIVADLNGFKFINKLYGESAGNNALCEFAAMLRMVCRTYGGIAARGYADHFYYFCHLRTSIERFVEKFSWISANLAMASHDTPHTFSPRYGISFATDHANEYTTGEVKTIFQLIGEATTARKIAKDSNDATYKIYNNDMEVRVARESEIERNMHKALRNGEFYLLYQPKIALDTDKIAGAEALVRWNSPEMGLLLPDEFIPVFERDGFIKELDFAVYEMAFKFLRRLLDEGRTAVPISLNMSRYHTDPEGFIAEFMQRFNKYNLPPNLIEIEILERAVANEKPILKQMTTGLKSLGFSVAMDDFGSGSSSLNMLGTIPVDTLKFDQNFLRDNPDTQMTRTFIKSLMQMAGQLKKKTVFEGVETQEQRDFLKSVNCDSVQGFFYSKPLSEADFVKFMEERS